MHGSRALEGDGRNVVVKDEGSPRRPAHDPQMRPELVITGEQERTGLSQASASFDAGSRSVPALPDAAWFETTGLVAPDSTDGSPSGARAHAVSPRSTKNCHARLRIEGPMWA
ncbi:MAG: hypothetical protein R3A78_13450 [Polyangiales bacterium]